jgi:secondary thiamine-phosphate synthase enzyme
MRHRFENHDLVTERRSQMIDVTSDVMEVVERSEVKNGMAVVYSPHTTCAILINEPEDGFQCDFEDLLDRLVPAADGAYYRHDDLTVRTQGIEDDTADFPNGHSHCRSVILSSSQTIPIVDGRLTLGQWQRIFFCELDRSRPRKVLIQVIGE